jgi:hypothetical protein
VAQSPACQEYFRQNPGTGHPSITLGGFVAVLSVMFVSTPDGYRSFVSRYPDHSLVAAT